MITPMFVSTREASYLTGRSEKWVRERCKAGALPYIRVGENAKRAHYKVLTADLLKLPPKNEEMKVLLEKYQAMEDLHPVLDAIGQMG